MAIDPIDATLVVSLIMVAVGWLAVFSLPVRERQYEGYLRDFGYLGFAIFIAITASFMPSLSVASSATTNVPIFSNANNAISLNYNSLSFFIDANNALTTNTMFSCAGCVITRASNGILAQTSGAQITSYNAPTGSYQVSGYIDVTALTLGTLSLQVNYTDDVGTQRLLTVPLTSLTGVVSASAGAVTDASALSPTIRVLGTNMIKVSIVGTGFTGTYNAYAQIVQVV